MSNYLRTPNGQAQRWAWDRIPDPPRVTAAMQEEYLEYERIQAATRERIRQELANPKGEEQNHEN